jgi:hypothetical protein
VSSVGTEVRSVGDLHGALELITEIPDFPEPESCSGI